MELKNNPAPNDMFKSREIKIAAIVIGILVLGATVYIGWTSPVVPEGYTTAGAPDVVMPTHPLIRVQSPIAGSAIRSPLAVSGEARGYWFFEASFPVKVVDERGRILGVAPVQAQGEWMTEAFVPFRGTIEFDIPESNSGAVIFERDNPSGLPENSDELRIPVRF